LALSLLLVHATFFTLIPIAIALLFIIWRFIHVDREEVEQTRKEEQRIGERQQQQKETEPIGKENNSEMHKTV
jgi:membrane protein implicated in regulation of membrane protease activity